MKTEITWWFATSNRGARLFAAVLLVVCGVTAADTAAGQALDTYRLGPGDRVRITVTDNPRDSGEFEVDGLGDMTYPPLGRIKAEGRTVAGMQKFIRAGLDKSFDIDPAVRVEVLNFRPFYIYGEVRRAGSYPYALGLTVQRAVDMAGGYTPRARRAPVKLIREGDKGMANVMATPDAPVLPGDIIEVSRRLK